MGKAHVLLLFLLLCWGFSAAPAAGGVLSAPERSLLVEMNRTRAAHGLGPLRIDGALQRAARAHSRDMLRRNYFSHGAFGSRMQRFGVRGPVIAENIAAGSGVRGRARAIVAGWLSSPSHRASLLRPGFTRVGVASLAGTFQGMSRARVVTADFAGR